MSVALCGMVPSCERTKLKTPPGIQPEGFNRLEERRLKRCG